MAVIDRDKVLALVDEILRAAVDDRGSVLFVKGPIGTGKTKLLGEAAERGLQLGAAAIMAGASPPEQARPLGLFLQLVRSAPFGEQDRREIDALTASLETDRSRTGPRVAQALDALCLKLVDLAGRRPLVITVDDVEYADDLTLRALAFLARQAPSARIVLVLSRSEPSGHADGAPALDVSRQPHCHVVELSTLSEVAVRDVARQLVGAKAGEWHHRLWWRLSGGNPLLLEALAADLLDSWRVSSGGEEPVSLVGARYGRAVVACVHRGGPHVLRVARGLAVLDGWQGLGELLDLASENLTEALQTLAAAGVTSGDVYRHEVARAAVLADGDAVERAEMHRRAAEITYRSGGPATTVAEHLRRASPVQQDWAVDVLVEAASRAMLRGGDVDAAREYLRTAHAACADERRRHEITVLLVRAEWRINPAVPADRFTELYDANRRGIMSGDNAVELARGLLWHGRSAEAGGVLRRLVESSDRLAPVTLHELAVLGRWLRATHPGLVDDRLRKLAEPDRYDAGTTVAAVRRLEAAGLLADVLTKGPGEDLAERAGRILRESQNGELSFDATVWSLKALTYGDQLERAGWWFETVTDRGAMGEAPNWRARLSALGAEIALRTGDSQAARRYAREALDLVPRRGWGVAIGEPLGTLILSATMTGQLGEAAELLEIPVPRSTFESRYGLHYLRARGRYHLATGNPELALRDFLRCAELMQSWGMATPAFVPCHSDAAEAWLRLHQPEKARALIEAELELCTPATPRAHGRALRLLAEISEPRRRPPLLHHATDLLQAAGDRFGMAEALTDLADAYRGVSSYRRAMTIAGRARVVAAGIAPAGPENGAEATPATGPKVDYPLALGTLSDAERRVASLAARGYSNREIAEQLWITVSTVEQHLTRAFRKLEVSRRVDLPDELKAIC